jgi:hypothetical protein
LVVNKSKLGQYKTNFEHYKSNIGQYKITIQKKTGEIFGQYMTNFATN